MLFETAVFWAILGFVLIGIEIFALNMILVFFGAGALAVAMLTGLGLTTSLTSQLPVFAGISLLVLYFLRRRFQKTFSGASQGGAGQEDDTGLAGRHATVTQEFKNGHGKVELGGTGWKAETDVAASLKAGDAVRVIRSKGITLLVEPILTQE